MTRPTLLALALFVGAGALYLKAREIMSQFSDKLAELSDVLTSVTAAEAARLQQIDTLTAANADLTTKLADAQGNAATPEDLEKLQTLIDQGKAIVQPAPVGEAPTGEVPTAS